MLVIPIVAFGEWFVESAPFLLASLKAPGNLPHVEARVIIYTDQPERFEGYEVHYLTPEELRWRGGEKGGKHKITSSCYAEAMRFGHPIVPLAADMVCSAHTLSTLEVLVSRGAKVVVVPVVRTVAQDMRQRLSWEIISLYPRELCALAFQYLHPRQEKMYWDKLPNEMAPTTIFRRVGNTIAARCFHMHPLLLNLPPDTPLSPGIDGELMARMRIEDCYVVTDSDEMVVFDLTDRDYNWSAGYLKRYKPDTRVDFWALDKANNTHLWFFEHECYVHAGEIERPPPDAAYEAMRDAVRRRR